MFGDLGKNEIEALLKREVIGRLGCHANGITYVVPVSYAYDGESIYVHTYEGRKMDFLRQNNSVCFQVDDTRNLSNWQSVICQGRFEEIKEQEGKSAALQILNDRKLPIISSETMHINSDWPFISDITKIDGIFFRIRITEKTGRFEKTSAEFFYGT